MSLAPFDPSEFVYVPEHWRGDDPEDVIQHILTDRSDWVTFRFYVEIFKRVMRAKFGREPTQAEVEELWRGVDRAHSFKPRPFPTDWDRPVTEGGETISTFADQFLARAPPQTPESQLLPDYEDQAEEDDPKTADTTATATVHEPSTATPTALDSPNPNPTTSPSPFAMATSVTAAKRKGKGRERDPGGVKAETRTNRTPVERQQSEQSWRRGQTFATSRRNQDRQGEESMGVGRGALTKQLADAADASTQRRAPAAVARPAWMTQPHHWGNSQTWTQPPAYRFRGVGENDEGRLLPRRPTRKGEKYEAFVTPPLRRDINGQQPPAFGDHDRTQPFSARSGAAADGRDESLPWKQRPNEGAYTGAPRPAYPHVFRPFGSNTRQRVVGNRSHITHMHHTGYAKGIVESVPTQPLLPSHSTLGQSGAASVTHGVAALRPGPSHYLFTHR